MPIASPAERLTAIAEQLAGGEIPSPVTVRAFLGWFGAQRRGYWKVYLIRSALQKAGLVTDPDFEGAYIDSDISFKCAPPEPEAAEADTPAQSVAQSAPETATEPPLTAQPLVGGADLDPTYRIGKLAAANTVPLAVTADASVQEAVTLMLLNDYSQLPVMQGERTVKGVISWQSIGSRLALGCKGDAVRDYMEPASEISADLSLFAAIGTIVSRQYVLVRGAEKTITGIITTSDLSLQFQQLAEPFLLIGEIENHVRRLIQDKFTPEQVKAACDPEDADRKIESVADLAFGEYQRLMDHDDRWNVVGLSVDRTSFIKQLDRIRAIRNDVMHFDPDPLGEEEIHRLRSFVRFLQTLQSIGAS